MPEATLRNFYEELKRRRVIRVATLYVVAIWPIIQLLDIISPTLELPDSVLRYLVIAFFAGLPFALILSWCSISIATVFAWMMVNLISRYSVRIRISRSSVACVCWSLFCFLSNWVLKTR